MEKIEIESLETKGVVFIVKYLGQTGHSEATLNINFNKQEIYYLENEVGVGGTCNVEIVQKEKQAGVPSAGYWTNITKVDMTSAVKGEYDGKARDSDLVKQSVQQSGTTQGSERFRTPNEMVATELTCALIGQIQIEDKVVVLVSDAVETYKECLRLLDE